MNEGPSSSRSVNGINDLLECPICYLPYVRPLQLSCGHSFCAACVDKLVDTARGNRNIIDEIAAAALFPFQDFNRLYADPVPPAIPAPIEAQFEPQPPNNNAVGNNGLGGAANAALQNRAQAVRQVRLPQGWNAERLPNNANDEMAMDDGPPFFGQMIRPYNNWQNNLPPYLPARIRRLGHNVALHGPPPVGAVRPVVPFGGPGGNGVNSVNSGVKIRCPECRKFTVVPPGGLPTNYRLQDMINRCTAPTSSNVAKVEETNSGVLLLNCLCCSEALLSGVYFCCTTCPNDETKQLCPTCAVRNHNGHVIDEKRILTSKDLQLAKFEIDRHTADATMSIEAIVDKCDNLGKQSYGELKKFLSDSATAFWHISSSVDNIEASCTKEELDAKVAKAALLANRFKELVNETDSAIATHREQLKVLCESFSVFMDQQNIILRKIKQEPEDDVIYINYPGENNNSNNTNSNNNSTTNNTSSTGRTCPAQAPTVSSKRRKLQREDRRSVMHFFDRRERARLRSSYAERSNERGISQPARPSNPCGSAPSESEIVEPIRVQAERLIITPKRRRCRYEPSSRGRTPVGTPPTLPDQVPDTETIDDPAMPGTSAQVLPEEVVERPPGDPAQDQPAEEELIDVQNVEEEERNLPTNVDIKWSANNQFSHP